MIKPTLDREKELWKDGKQFVAGLDEAGRGAWAGPVVAAVVVLPSNHKRHKDIADSKLISPQKRAKLYEYITEHALDFGIGIIEHDVIDKIGILEATKEASKMAVEMLRVKPDFLITDALDLKKQLDVNQEAIIKADQKIYSVSCASIIAKVTRDNLMSSLGDEYTVYQFSRHKGYGTKLHQDCLKRYGISNLHRKSYQPIKELL